MSEKAKRYYALWCKDYPDLDVPNLCFVLATDYEKLEREIEETNALCRVYGEQAEEAIQYADLQNAVVEAAKERIAALVGYAGDEYESASGHEETLLRMIRSAKEYNAALNALEEE